MIVDIVAFIISIKTFDVLGVLSKDSIDKLFRYIGVHDTAIYTSPQ